MRGAFQFSATAAIAVSMSTGSGIVSFCQSRSPDPEAMEIANHVLAALGGQEAWERARYIRFTFNRGNVGLGKARYTLTWDKWTGRYRLEGTAQEGLPYVVLMNVNTRDGEAYLDGSRLEGKELEKYLTQAFSVWTGETYWLLMPYKLKDPGVILAYDGEEEIRDVNYDKLYISFDNVGLKPGDQFWVYVNKETHLVDRWRFVLEDGYEGDYWWKDWRKYGPLLLSSIRETPEGEVAIWMEDIFVADELPEEVFTSPAPVVIPGPDLR